MTNVHVLFAERPDIVQDIRSEWGFLDQVPDDSFFLTLTVDKLLEKRVSHAVFLEILRLNPPISFTFRTAVEPISIMLPSGQDIVVPAGMKIVASFRQNMRSWKDTPTPNDFDHTRFFGEAGTSLQKSWGFCPFGGKRN
jgi:cytochrome P450